MIATGFDQASRDGHRGVPRRSELMRIHLQIGATLAVIAAVTAGANATLWTFNDVMDGAQEVPPTGSLVVGNVNGTYNDVTNQGVLNATANGFSTSITTSHLHGPAGPGATAGTVVTIGAGSGGPNNYVVSNFNFALTEQQEGWLLGGLVYINVHTLQFPGGEIRGQLHPVPEPGTAAAIGLGLGALFLRRRRRT
jgi:hypothetical protein